MTTIAYNHKDREIAFDSRSTRSGIIMSDSVMKMEAHNGVVFFLAGYACDFHDLINMYFSDIKTELRIDAGGYVYDKGIFYRIGVESCGSYYKQILIHNDSVGSGSKFALAAMDFGLNAEGAVKYAATRDIKTGGEVRVFEAIKYSNG